MIYVTQGHERGIGIEVFLKSFILLSVADQKNFTLACSKQSLENTLRLINIPYSFEASNETLTILGTKLKLLLITTSPVPESTAALELVIQQIKDEDILVTLPTSKDQLVINNRQVNGHTEWFRAHYNTDVAMFFKSHEANVLLVTDHLPLNEVSSTITKELIEHKISLCQKEYNKYFGEFKNIFISGINPHSGEGGLLGLEEVKLKMPHIKFIPADSLLVSHSFSDENLFVYMYHDQGLAPFKTLFKTIGANITLGLPYLRLSVDHGTAFDLYGKNSADYMGSYYILKMALLALRKSNSEKK